MSKADPLLPDTSKTCRVCLEVKNITLFVKNHVCRSGYDSICKSCNQQRVTEWRKTGKRNSAKESRLYYQRYPEKLRRNSQIWRANNKDKVALINANSKIKRQNRNATWEKELTSFITSELHLLRRQRDKLTNIRWHVDHIIPLNGKKVSGLHVWNNLRLIPAIENQRKSNQYENETGY